MTVVCGCALQLESEVHEAVTEIESIKVGQKEERQRNRQYVMVTFLPSTAILIVPNAVSSYTCQDSSGLPEHAARFKGILTLCFFTMHGDEMIPKLHDPTACLCACADAACAIAA